MKKPTIIEVLKDSSDYTELARKIIKNDLLEFDPLPNETVEEHLLNQIDNDLLGDFDNCCAIVWFNGDWDLDNGTMREQIVAAVDELINNLVTQNNTKDQWLNN